MTDALILGFVLGHFLLAPIALILYDEIGWRRRGYKRWPWENDRAFHDRVYGIPDTD